MPRLNDRPNDDLRPMDFRPGFLRPADGSCLAGFGGTRVLCTASVSPGVPPWLEGRGLGWITAEYAMLPASTGRRRSREGRKGGGLDGRSVEIQRLIGRVLRGAVDRSDLGERTVTIDCDVLEADGGTRTTAINGGFVALAQALGRLEGARVALRRIGAISVGVVDDEVMLDLDYPEDARAEADMNLVMNDQGHFLEVQASAEGRAFTPAELGRALELGQAGIERVMSVIDDAIANAPAGDLA